MTALALPLADRLAALMGGDAVLPEGALGGFSIDGLVPQAAVRPATRQGIVQALRWATEEGIAVYPRGGGTQLALGNVPRRVGLVLDLSRYNRVLDYQPSDLTATVEAGITLESMQHQLAPGGKFLGVEAPLAGRATVGGILAAGATGPLRFGYGLPRDWLIGVRVVDAQGVETKAGGKVVKNVTGYDLGKLYTGSLGTLGVIVEATFKLSPLPTDAGALVAVFPSAQAAVQAGAQLLRQTYAPLGVQVLNGPLAGRVAHASAHRGLGAPAPVELPPLRHGEALALAFFAGRARAVERRLRESAGLLRERGAHLVEETGSSQAAEWRRQVTDLGWEKSDAPYLGVKVSVPASQVGRVLGWLGPPSSSSQPDSVNLGHPGAVPGVVADPGFGLVRLLWWAEAGDAPWEERNRPSPPLDQGGWGGLDEAWAAAAVGELQNLAAGLGGSAVVEHAPLAVKRRIDVWGEPPEGIEVMRRIKQKFDPAGLLNPGRFVGGI